MGNNFFNYLNVTSAATNTASTYFPAQWVSGNTTAQPFVVQPRGVSETAKPKTQRGWLAERVEETCAVGREALAA